MDMEHALYLSRTDLKDDLEDRYTRVYYGAEFCQNLIPTTKELGSVLDLCERRKLDLTLLTPFVTDAGLDKLEPLFALMAERRPGSEVVINDWGTLRMINDRFDALVPVFGRLITRQKRGPRLSLLKGKVPDAMVDHFRRLGITVPVVRRFLSERRIGRIELDWPLQGLDVNLDFPDVKLSGTLYMPWVYVTTTRLCLTNACDQPEKVDRVGIFPCGRECETYTFRLTHPTVPVELVLKGNTQFYRNEDVPSETELEAMGIDRLVFEPEVPGG